MRTTMVFLSLLIFSPGVFSFEKAGDSGLPGEYLYSFGSGARGLSLGLAETTFHGNAYNSYSNPSGLGDLWWKEGSITFVPLFQNTKYYNISYGYPLKKQSAVAFNLISLTSVEAEKTNELGEVTGSFGSQDTCFTVSYGKKYNNRFYYGLNIKTVMQAIDDYSQKGAGMDFGVMYRQNEDKIWAFSLQNIVQPRLGEDVSPKVLKLGVSRAYIPRRLYLYGDLSSVNQSMKYFVGTEYFYVPWFSLRAGLNVKQLSIGLGFKTRQLDFDYAFIYHPLEILHAISLTCRYGFEVTEAEEKIRTEWNVMNYQKQLDLKAINEERSKMSKEKEGLKLQFLITAKLLEAKNVVEAKKYEEGKKLLEEIIKLDKNNKEALKTLTEVNTRLDKKTVSNKMKEAKKNYEKASYDEALKLTAYILDMDKDNQEALVLSFLIKSRLYLKAKKYQEAKSTLVEILAIQPDNAEAIDMLNKIQNIIDVLEEK